MEGTLSQMMQWEPSWQTLVFITVFMVVYEALLIQRATRNVIDIFDLFILSLVALVPAGFAYFPHLAAYLARLVGVTFPFLLLFGFLFVVVFAYLYHVIVKLNHQQRHMTAMVQELTLLRDDLERHRRRQAHTAEAPVDPDGPATDLGGEA